MSGWLIVVSFFVDDTATTEIYTYLHTLSLHDALPISAHRAEAAIQRRADQLPEDAAGTTGRSEEHTSELQSLMRISYAVFCLKKKKIKNNSITNQLMYEIIILQITSLLLLTLVTHLTHIHA